MTDTMAWDTYSRKKPTRRETNAAGETTWFNWTQYPDHGPGVDVIGAGPGASVLELGCGKGGNLAHVAALGARAVGVDLSAAQLDAACERWDDLELHRRDAIDYLAGCGERFDAVYSVFGAVWFTNPDDLLPAVRDRLSPGGIFAFSQRPTIEGCYGCQASYINRHDDPEALVVKRWDYAPETWVERLRANGFTDVTAEVVPAPGGNRRTGTLLVRAARC